MQARTCSGAKSRWSQQRRGYFHLSVGDERDLGQLRKGRELGHGGLNGIAVEVVTGAMFAQVERCFVLSGVRPVAIVMGVGVIGVNVTGMDMAVSFN